MIDKKITPGRSLVFPYLDRVYGKIRKNELDDFVLEIIRTKVFKHLEKIHQHGPDIFWDSRLDGTRAEHSLGVYLLLKKLGAEKSERLAGLLHDLSHTAFSHVADFVYGDHRDHKYADSFLLSFFQEPALASIIKKVGSSPEKLVENPAHTLLERPVPDLCADRLDYLYRDCLMKGLVGSLAVRRNLQQLTVVDGEIVFKTRSAARFCGELYLLASEKILYFPRSLFVYQKLGEAIKLALEKGILSRSSLFGTDDQVWEILTKCENPLIEHRLRLVTDCPKLTMFKKPGPGRQHFLSKPRWIDPKFVRGSGLVKLSDVDQDYGQRVIQSIDWQKRGFFIGTPGNLV